jgi:LysM repeat protein
MKHIKYLMMVIMMAIFTTAMAQNSTIRTNHKVEKSETIFGIAKKYGITIEELIKANPVMNQPGYELKRGETINIPYAKGQDPTTKTETKTVPATTTAPASTTAPATTTPPTQAKTTTVPTTKPTTTAVAGKKEVKVGVMLPLHDNDGDGRRMVEYYRGLLLGVDRVKKDGITVDMQAWNVPIDADINTVLNGKEAADCDIIFGPLYTKMVKPLADFCTKNDIMMVIPFSISGNDVENYSNIYQVYQPQEDFDRQTIKNFIQWFNNYHVVIIDCEDEKSTKGDFTKKLRAELDNYALKYSLTSLKTNDKNFAKAFSLSKQNVVVVNTEHSPSLNATLAKLNILTEKNTDISVSLFGYKEWLMYTKVYLDYYYKYDAYIPTYFYYNEVSADTKWVERNYKKWFEKDMMADALPRFALTGFDHACFFIGGYTQFGKNFNGGKGQMTYKPVQSPLKFRNAGKGHKNTNFMFVHYKNDRTIESVNY